MRKRNREVEFVLVAPTGSRVSVAGTFNQWDPEALPLADHNGDGVFRGRLELAPGAYEYKFVVDGAWILDEGNPDFAANDFGTLNSVLKI